MRPNLERKAPPAITQPRHMPPLGYKTAAYALAFTITIGATVAHEDYQKRMSIGPASLRASDERTNTVSFEEKGSTAVSWLATAIAEMHANIPDDAWKDVPDTSKIDIDSL